MNNFKKICCAIAAFIFVAAFSTVGAKASLAGEIKTVYTNSETGFVAGLYDGAGVLSPSEEQSIISDMRPLTKYGNIVVYTTEILEYGSTRALGDAICEYFAYENTSVFIIDFDTRTIQIQSSGQNLKDIPTSKAENITYKTYKYATDGDYEKCIRASLDEMYSALSGAHISMPLKHMSNFFIAIMSGLFITYLVASATSANKKASAREVTRKLRAAYMNYDYMNVVHVHTDKVYSPQSSGGGGGGHGGGGGGHSGGGGHHF